MTTNGVPGVRDRLLERRQTERSSGIDFEHIQWIKRTQGNPTITLVAMDDRFNIRINAAAVELLRRSGRQYGRLGITTANNRPALVIDPIENRSASSVSFRSQGIFGGSWVGRALYSAGWAAGDYEIECIDPQFVVRGKYRGDR